MATTVLLLAMVVFVAWACFHDHRRINWFRDELDGEAFIAALRASDPVGVEIVLDTSAWDEAIAKLRETSRRTFPDYRPGPVAVAVPTPTNLAAPDVDLDEVLYDWKVWTGRAVHGEGIGVRQQNAKIAAHRVAHVLPYLLDETKRLRGFDERVEYGHQTVELGWVPEYRGIKYATHQRTVQFRNGEPLLIDHWSDPAERKPFDPQPESR